MRPLWLRWAHQAEPQSTICNTVEQDENVPEIWLLVGDTSTIVGFIVIAHMEWEVSEARGASQERGRRLGGCAPAFSGGEACSFHSLDPIHGIRGEGRLILYLNHFDCGARYGFM